MRRSPRTGFTLLEVVVGIVIVGTLTTVAVLGTRALDRRPTDQAWPRSLWRARAESLRTGRPVTVVADTDSAAVTVVFLPDGRAIGPGLDPLTGRRER